MSVEWLILILLWCGPQNHDANNRQCRRQAVDCYEKILADPKTKSDDAVNRLLAECLK